MKTTLRTVALLTAIFGITLYAGADGQRTGRERQDRENTHQCRKGNDAKKEKLLERFDKNGDGKLGPKEREHAKKALRKHRQNQSGDTDE